MSESGQQAVSPTAAAFAEHVRAFHKTLPAEEQVLLERLFALAEAAIADEGEVSGYVIAEKLGADGVSRKHIGGVKYEDTTVIFPLPRFPQIFSHLSGPG